MRDQIWQSHFADTECEIGRHPGPKVTNSGKPQKHTVQGTDSEDSAHRTTCHCSWRMGTTVHKYCALIIETATRREKKTAEMILRRVDH